MHSTSREVRPFDLRCLVHFLTNGTCDETNNCVIFGNCTNGRDCRRPVHFVPRGIYSRCHGLHNHSRRRMPIGPHINWHRNQLPCVQPRRFVYNVRAREYNIQRQHRLICIRTGLRNGIKYKPSHHDAHRHTGPRANIVCVGGSGGGWRSPDRRGVGSNDHPAGIAGTPPQRGTLARNGNKIPRICADNIYTLYSTLFTLLFPRCGAGIIKTGRCPVFVRTPLTVFIHMRHTISQPDNFQRMHCPILRTQSAPGFPSLRRPVCNLSGPICIDSNR